KNFNYLSASSNLRDDIEAASRSGYFRERTLILTGKSGSRHRLNVSGFHLGLVNELTGYILLKIARPDGTKVAVEELQKAAIEIDRFIYRTAHDLRGPLATIKGLIHLIRIRENDDDIDRFAILLEAHANLLDERLFQLVYV